MRPAVGEFLARSGALTPSGLKATLDWQKTHGGTIERALLASGTVTETVLAEAFSASTGLPAAGRERLLEADPWAVAALPPDARRRLRALPFEKLGGELLVAVSDPDNPVLGTGLAAATGYAEIRLFAVPEPVLDDLLSHWEREELRRAAERRQEPAAEEEPPGEAIEKLARALLVDALHGSADGFELGVDRRGGYSRTHHFARPPLTRRLPGAVVRQLLTWFRGRLAAADPTGGASFFAEVDSEETGRTRLLVELTEKGPEGMRFHFRVAGASTEGPCPHDAAEGDVFCPACGAPL
ncbi:MAG: hypothetical protein EDX89_20085 [Acidobacteria bacterium]|nr:MAG: hypothetical protein EDX89_20085 [Acidobacteriota bacterium]